MPSFMSCTGIKLFTYTCWYTRTDINALLAFSSRDLNRLHGYLIMGVKVHSKTKRMMHENLWRVQYSSRYRLAKEWVHIAYLSGMSCGRAPKIRIKIHVSKLESLSLMKSKCFSSSADCVYLWGWLCFVYALFLYNSQEKRVTGGSYTT